ncbi:hypothetical protein [Breznakiella homolactica]|uniref:Lipoprotein n=1 Tax=Breznakiella homolactica TaxID=2798577 RepID=A0A7T7XMS1_9SPIR|nr:hypothetical protein [Breznakiella homolactica]QQO09226.1 hypothetical protein JFL75_20220 [Breznakiella homolactica]
MKLSKKICLTVLVLLAALVFFACDNPSNSKPDISEGLDGTKWECKFSEGGFNLIEILEFSTNTVNDILMADIPGYGKEKISEDTYNYSYSPATRTGTINEIIPITITDNEILKATGSTREFTLVY